MRNSILLSAAVLGFIAVALGAFGAHGLQSALAGAEGEQERLAWWATGVRYQMWHALLLVGVGALARDRAGRALAVAHVLVWVGVLLFSGSLYVMTLTHFRALGAVTPIGGLCFLAAWVSVALHALRARD